MFNYILFFKFVTLSVIIADPGLSAINPDAHKSLPPAAAPFNYYGYRQAQAQQQLQTASPYLNKRNPDTDTYSNFQQSQSSLASPYGNVPTRSSANQCKLHINCPSKKIK